MATSAWSQSPIGTLKADGRFEIRAAGDEQATRLNQDDYTFFSGDTIIARWGPAVLNLADGGGLGVTKGSEIEVSLADDGLIETRLISGSVLYAFPDDTSAFLFRAGNFTIAGSGDQPRAIRVSRDAGRVGTIELLEDGNIRAAVRQGSLTVTNGDAVRYQVNAGESVGLLDLPNQTIQVQGAVRTNTPMPPVLIQSPEQVRTNENFLVRWEAFDPVDGDFIVIAEEGADPDEFESVVSSDEGRVLEFEAPGDPGDYEIRFIDGETGEIKRFVDLDVRRGVIAAYWWQNPGIGVMAGAVAVYIGAQIVDDNNRRPVSP